MAERKPSNGAAAGTGQVTMSEYKKAQARVRDLVEKRRMLEKRLTQVEDSISQKETAYLDSTPSGNIITGFDNYMKGMSGAAAQRRKAGPMEQNRVFSRSSISYRPNNLEGITPGSGGSTPAGATPLSAAFRDGPSNHPTPTSSTAVKNASKSKKKTVEHEDSENDTSTSKKRTNFGAQRK
ncbi:histone acetyltransferase subunit NuA4-domain-containing protein [Fusarium sp. MPI-SDFR-AT-0072]|uniref:Chromatin modification-related protein EAF6 n=1 Tax=Fusarium oxysporum f. sp. rapae TaxID=485398 RepID=A0A8J5PK12_FUSOX|nr:Chromatin modification-related protein eaf6 [Fusarium oxysporum f. sp. rapae]KAH7181387.1 histone acetyltransferase subunit NuA4-domain-containing protein [Fusarium sp. MPI-SDFR-AT-0072]